MTRPVLAVITLDERGGGVATTARLLRRALRDHWGDHCHVATLVQDPGEPPSFHSSFATRLQFGASLALRQSLGACDWLLFSHLGLAQVQRFVPVTLRRPYAVFVYDVEAWSPLPPTRAQVLRDAFVRVACSTYTATRVMDANPDVGPVVACPLALEPTEDDDSHALDVPEIGPRAVMIVGRMSSLERYKGHDQLLEAWPDVMRRVPEARLVFVGIGDDVPRLRAKAAECGVGDALICPGFVANRSLQALYQRAAVFAMPSRREGFGLVYLEAMTHGLPCIGSIHDASGEVIQDGVSGFLVDQSDTAALAERLVRLLTNESLRSQMGAAGERRVAEQFTYDTFTNRLLAIIPAEFGARGPAHTPVLGSIR